MLRSTAGGVQYVLDSNGNAIGTVGPNNTIIPLGASTNGSIIELGLSLVDRGYAPAYSTGAGVVNQITNSNPLWLAMRRAKTPRSIYYSAGQSGDTIPGALSRWTTDVYSRVPMPGTVWYLNGGNDINLVNTTSDIESVVTSMKTNFEATFSKAQSVGINFNLNVLPDNGTWTARRERYFAFWRWNRYQYEFARRNNIKLANIASSFSWPDKQLPLPATSIVVASNVATATTTAPHGYSSGDSVFNLTAANATFLVVTGATITVTGANTFTYPFVHADGSAANGGAFIRNNVLPNLMADPPSNVHYNPAGAQKASRVIYETLQTGVMDTLVFTEGDAENIVGVGLAGTNNNVFNRGMFIGTGGSKTGTAVSHTGNVATGWTSNVISGNPTAVTLSQTAYTDAGRSQMQYQEISIQAAAGADCHYQLNMTHALPTAWAGSTGKSLGNWVMPTVANGYFYCCTIPGTTAASPEPTWPTTPGVTVTDGSVTWECRRAWINNNTEKYRLGAEYQIVSVSSADALKSISFGLFDESTAANSILDGDDAQNTVGPSYIAGENGYFGTTAAPIAVATTAPNVALKVWVKANTTVVLRLGRASWYRSTIAI